ncbi:MAG: 4-(cytidine 5'-diphospho)-2-C-methyl-D-erythritol kinase [Gemmatimonadota bacterium]|nr:MAG: 4-(cytidine 5'-diphospho)-2-C-methyl-D-erythritol kinase [Gemmatimonadota bacterium]
MTETEAGRVTIRAHAKTNLFLRVLAREESGYHSIETLFTLLELHDTITLERAESGIELQVTGADTGPVEQNLVYRAAQMVLQATGTNIGLRVSLQKEIPPQAGLGGGSSDGAAALHAVNHMVNNAVPRHEILQFAAKLGSDVAFFASGAPMAIGWSRGERLFRVPAPKPAAALVVVPDFGVSTKDAYEMLRVGKGSGDRRGAVVLDLDALTTWGGIGRLGGNDFETVLFGKLPELRELFERLAQTGPRLVRVSGSGSAVAAIYANENQRDNAALEIGEGKRRVIKTMTRATAAPGPESG